MRQHLPAKRIAIIGAGWTGIGCLRILREKGYEIDVYEKNNDIGGTWHPDNNYAGLKLHSPALTIEYFDFPLPNSLDRFERLHSHQVFQYIKSYCDHHQLQNNILFNKKVIKVSFDSKNQKSKIYFSDEKNYLQASNEYDYVIYTNGYSDKTIPKFKKSDSFEGKLFHALSVPDSLLRELISENNQIAVVGGSKGATDFIIKLRDYGCKAHWLMRKPYWFFNFTLRKRWLKNTKRSFLHKTIFLFGLIISNNFPSFALRMWSWFGLIDTFGRRHADFKKFHFGMIDENQFKILREYYLSHGIEGEISEFYKNGFVLKNGKKIAADVVICCTGSGPAGLELELEVDHQKFDASDIKKIYHSRIIPEIPNLIFTAYHQFSIGTVDGLLQANWIAEYMRHEFNANFLQSHATEFEIPFFSKAALFDSQSYIIFSISKMYYPFFQSKEISTLKFLKWFMDSTFNGHKKIAPFNFKPPTYLRQNSISPVKSNFLYETFVKISKFLLSFSRKFN